MSNLNIDIQLQPKQKLLLKEVYSGKHTIIGYGGSAGGAKSHAIRDVNLILCLNTPGINTLIFRKLSNDLLENHINPFFFKYPQLKQYLNKSEKMIYFPNGSTTKFGYAERPDDILNFQGKEYDYIFVDEATHCTQSMIEFLLTRNRGKIKLPKMILTMNPGNIGHAYMKRLFIDKMYVENENPDDYLFISAKIYDNIIWSIKELIQQGYTVNDYYVNWKDEQRKEFCHKYSEYAKRLQKLPYETRMAYLEGDWDVFGGMFFKGFNRAKAEIEGFTIPREWKLIAGLDPGYSSPCAFSLAAQDYTGKIYIIGTYYEPGKSPAQNAQDIKSFIANNPFTGGRMPEMIISGLDAFAQKDRYAIVANERTFSDIFQDAGLYLSRAVTDRKQGWWNIKSLIESDSLYFFKGYNNAAIDEMQAATTDLKEPEDLLGRGNKPDVPDLALDEIRYLIFSLFKPIAKPPQEILRSRNIQPKAAISSKVKF